LYPKQHALVSGTSVFIYSLITGLSPVNTFLWTILGTVSGVLIDVDHAILPMLLKKKYSEGLKWFKNPVKAITRPSEFLDDMEYDNLVYHRLVSHTTVLAFLIYLTGLSVLFVPISLAVGVHILCDLGYDLYNGSYWFQE